MVEKITCIMYKFPDFTVDLCLVYLLCTHMYCFIYSSDTSYVMWAMNQQLQKLLESWEQDKRTAYLLTDGNSNKNKLIVQMWIKLGIDLFLCLRSTTYLPFRNMEVILKSQSSEEKYINMFLHYTYFFFY